MPSKLPIIQLPETLAYVLSLRGFSLAPETKLVLIYLAAYGKLSLGNLVALTELSRIEVRAALRDLAALGWVDKEGELSLPPRFANTPQDIPRNV